MHGLETPFDCDKVWREGQVADRMNVARETGDKGPDKIVAHGGFSIKDSSGKMDYDVICIIGENLTFIRAFPGVEILLEQTRGRFPAMLELLLLASHCSLHTTQ